MHRVRYVSTMGSQFTFFGLRLITRHSGRIKRSKITGSNRYYPIDYGPLGNPVEDAPGSSIIQVLTLQAPISNIQHQLIIVTIVVTLICILVFKIREIMMNLEKWRNGCLLILKRLISATSTETTPTSQISVKFAA